MRRAVLLALVVGLLAAVAVGSDPQYAERGLLVQLGNALGAGAFFGFASFLIATRGSSAVRQFLRSSVATVVRQFSSPREVARYSRTENTIPPSGSQTPSKPPWGANNDHGQTVLEPDPARQRGGCRAPKWESGSEEPSSHESSPASSPAQPQISDGEFEFEVALSFANEDRAYVSEVAGLLKEQGVKVFYDEFYQADMWGMNLTEYLDDVYRRRARYAVIFLSRAYVEKPWTRLERRSALARALDETNPYVLPVRLDDSEVPGLSPTIGFVDARQIRAPRLAQLIVQRLGGGEAPLRTASAAIPPAEWRVPRTVEMRSHLLAERPPAWEYLLFASYLLEGKTTLEPKWRDHQLRYRRLVGAPLSDREAVQFVGAAMSELGIYIDNFERVLSRKVQDAAFGPSGEPGDPEQINHLAQRLLEIYESFLDWTARVRGVNVTSNLVRLMELTASYLDSSVAATRSFFDRYVAEVDSIPQQLARAEKPINVPLVLRLDVDDRVSREFHREMKRTKRRLGLR